MWMERPIIRLLLLLLEPLLELAVVRLTARFCIGACCKWVATTLVEALFSQHAGTLYVLSGVLDVFLFCFCLDLILETLEKDLNLPARRWLDTLYDSIFPNGDPPDESPRLPEARKSPAQLKTAPVKRSKMHARHPPNVESDAPDPVPAVITPDAGTRRASRRNKNQGLEG